MKSTEVVKKLSKAEVTALQALNANKQALMQQIEQVDKATQEILAEIGVKLEPGVNYEINASGELVKVLTEPEALGPEGIENHFNGVSVVPLPKRNKR